MWKCKECGGDVKGSVDFNLTINRFIVSKNKSLEWRSNDEEILEACHSDIISFGADSYECEDCCENSDDINEIAI